jgi:type I restriction-modification system DNA methylase subunit
MALFQTSVLKKYLAQQDQTAVDKAYRKYSQYFLNPEIQENIRISKEEQFQATFLTELFVNVLDYTINPSPKYNLTTEYKNEKNNRKADGAILHNEITVAVVELKGTNTKDLESIRRQAFDYKVNHKGCRFVITSNFEKLRLYIDDATDHEAFDLFQLTPEKFALLYLCLQKDNLLKAIPLNIKQDSLVKEEQITKDFYKDYSQFKRELYRDLVRRNKKRLRTTLQGDTKIPEDTEHQNDLERLEKNIKLTLFKKSQKLIDRFLFIFFAEDRDLLEYNYTKKLLKDWQDVRKLDIDEPLYDRFKKHFNYLDQGRKNENGRTEIFAYNGGLFKPDPILDSLEIDDDLLHNHTYALSTYDFESQVDVNILGHIFENSLNEIESITAEIVDGEFDKQKSKRKKDGVFYTPKYITKYIVENTVGKLCDEKKTSLGFREEEYFKGRGVGRKKRNDSTIQKLVGILDDYRNWLLQITICDPACGSGAFLNQALDFLIKEHQYIDELKAKVLGGGLQFPDIENTILEHNIFGVDLNEESVEIAKLSLWLRTAQPRRKLNDLSSNIKCGNSLIDSKTIAGDKAFHWETAFTKVFANGGFDVVIGNPPYVRQELLDSKEKKWLTDNYTVGTGAADLYIYFYNQGLNILKENGILGFITPNKFIKARYGKNLRNYISQFDIIRLIDFGELPVFSDASTFPLIALVNNKKVHETSFHFCQIENLDNKDFTATVELNSIIISSEQIQTDDWNLINIDLYRIMSKLKDNSELLGNNFQLNYGIKTGYNDAFIIDKKTREFLINSDYKAEQIIKPFLKGTDIRKNYVDNSEQYLVFTRRGFDIQKFPSINSHLLPYQKRLTPGIKGGRKKGDYQWFEIQDTVSYYEDFENDKIIFPVIAKESRFVLDREGYYFNDKAFMISNGDISLCTLLNSKLIWFFLKNTCSVLGDPNKGGRLELRGIYMKLVPISKKLFKNSDFDSVSRQYEQVDKEFYSLIKKLKEYITHKFSLLKISKKLENWQNLDFGEFIKELNKAIKITNKQREKENQQPIAILTTTDEFAWFDLFEQNKKKAQELKSQINSIEQQIDAMVYELYGLSDAEIKIVENS